jgi:hypothetical protein
MKTKSITLLLFIFLLSLSALLGYLNQVDVRMVSAASDLTLTKTDNLNPLRYDQLGQVVEYTLTATNNGTIILTNVTVSDAPALASFSCIPAIPVASLDLGASVVCNGTHTITQADLDAGSFADTGSAASTEAIATNAPDTILATQNYVLGLTKTDNLNPLRYDHVGQAVVFTLTATNNGNVTLHNVTVSDAPALTSFSCIPSIPVASLAPGISIVCSGTHTITQANLDAGSFADTGSANSTEVIATNAPDTIQATQNNVLGMVKTATPATYDSVGDVISYSYLVNNSGNVTLAGPVTVTDDKAIVNCPIGSLAPSETKTCAASYTIKQVDLDSGSVKNTAQAHVNGTNSNFDDETVMAIQNPALTIVKTANPTTYIAVGNVIGYSFLVTSSGNVRLAGPVTVYDNKATNEVCPPITSVGNQDAYLDPGESITCTANYAIQYRDMTSGSVTNIAYATGVFGEGTVTSNNGSKTVTALEALRYTFIPLVKLSRPGVQILPSSFNYIAHDTMFIIGEVLNNTIDSVTSVDVTVNFFNAKGDLKGTGHTYMWPIDLPVGEKGCFSISMNVPPDWSYYQFEVPTYYKSSSSSGLTVFNDSGSYSADGSYIINGQVRNNGKLSSNLVSVSGTLYNVSGMPVGCEHAIVNSTNLNPGQVSSFAINFLGYWRDYKDVTYYRLRVAGDLP